MQIMTHCYKHFAPIRAKMRCKNLQNDVCLYMYVSNYLLLQFGYCSTVSALVGWGEGEPFDVRVAF